MFGWLVLFKLGGSPKLTPQQYVCPYVSSSKSSKLQVTKNIVSDNETET